MIRGQSADERWLWLVVVPSLRLGVGRGAVRRGRAEAATDGGATTRVEKHLDARAKTRRRAREGFARGGSARRASSDQRKSASIFFVTENAVKRTSSSAWRGPCGTECRWDRPARKSPSCGAKEFPLLATPRQGWSAPSHRSRAPVAPGPLGPSRNSRLKKSRSPHRDPTCRCFRATRRAGWTPPRARTTRPSTTERAYFAHPSDCWSETGRNPPRAAPARTPSGSVLPPPLPTGAHHRSCFSGTSRRFRRVTRAARASFRRDAGDGGWVREVIPRRPFDSPDVANLRRASSGRSPRRCGKVTLRPIRGALYPLRASGLQRSDWLRLSRQEVLRGSSQWHARNNARNSSRVFALRVTFAQLSSPTHIDAFRINSRERRS